MNITFSFDNTIFEVEANPPASEYDIIEIPRRKWKKIEGKVFPRLVEQEPEKLMGRCTIHPVKFTFNSVSQPILHNLIYKRMRNQTEVFTGENSRPPVSAYKFDVKMSNDEDIWRLYGCFLLSVDIDEDIVTVELSVDHIIDATGVLLIG